MKLKIFFIVLLLPLMALAQKKPREILRGHIAVSYTHLTLPTKA